MGTQLDRSSPQTSEKPAVCCGHLIAMSSTIMKRHLSRKMAGSDGFVGRTKISWETYLRRKLLGGEGILRVLLWEEHLRAPLFARVGRDTDCHHELCNQRWAEPLFLHGEALRTLTEQSSVYFSLRGIAYFCSHTLSIQSVWGLSVLFFQTSGGLSHKKLALLDSTRQKRPVWQNFYWRKIYFDIKINLLVQR